jgi:hypothetical protein
MPLDFIGEAVLRGFLEVIGYAIAYYTGGIVLAVLPLGQLQLAPFETLGKTNRDRNRWNDWSIWLYRPMQPRVLKAESACVVGLIFWVAVGVGLFLVFRDTSDKKQSERSASIGSEATVTRHASGMGNSGAGVHSIDL